MKCNRSTVELCGTLLQGLSGDLGVPVRLHCMAPTAAPPLLLPNSQASEEHCDPFSLELA